MSRCLVGRLQATVLIVAIFTWGCGGVSNQRATTDTALTLNQRIGWLHGPCLAISNPGLAHGTPVALVMTGEPQRVLQARILEQSDSPSTCPALMEGRKAQNAKDGKFFYKLETTSVSSTDMGLGIVNPPASTAIVNGLARADLDHDGHSEVFSSCATSEGIKFAVWTDKAYQGTALWSGYDYLDYEMTPTCP